MLEPAARVVFGDPLVGLLFGLSLHRLRVNFSAWYVEDKSLTVLRILRDFGPLSMKLSKPSFSFRNFTILRGRV